MNTKVLTAISLISGIAFIFTPCIPEFLFPVESTLDHIGKLYISEEFATGVKSDHQPAFTVIQSRDSDGISIDSITDEYKISQAIPDLTSYSTDNNTTSDLVTEESVWITKSGKKYHSKPDCSGIKNPIESTIIDASQSGYSPCKKCYKNS